MRIRVDEIPESGRTLRFHWDQERFAEFLPPDDPFNLELIRPVNVVLNLDRHPDHIRVTGEIEGLFKVSCHRCLKPVELPVKEPVDIYLLAEDHAPGEEEKELEKEDLAYDFFDGEVIEIDQLVSEQIFLTLPFKVLCSEECKGLCPGCGANLNDEACRCKEDDRKSPFAKLAAIKVGLPESGK